MATVWPGVFFIHVMKTGGTSFSRLLRTQFDQAAVYPVDTAEAPPLDKALPERVLALSGDERASIELFSVHMAAWVAEELAPRHLRVTALREPLGRTLSHLRQIARLPDAPDDIEAIYENDAWRARLSNYQTQPFAQTKDAHE